MIERTSGTQPRCLSYGGTVIILQPHSSLLPIPRKQERERERDPGWVWSRVSRTKFMLREDAAILCGHPSPRRSSCLQAKGSTFISQPQLLVWPCESKYWPPTLQSSAQLTELILPWLRKALHPKNSPKVQLRHYPNHTKTSKWPVVSCPPPCCFQLLLGELLKKNFGGNELESTCIMEHSKIVTCETYDKLLPSAVKLASVHTTSSCNSRLHSLRFSSHFFNNCFTDFLVSFLMSFLWGLFT